MNKQKFVEFIRKPKTLTPKDIEELEQVVAEFPYFQNARAIIAKGSKLNQLPGSDQKVATAAVYAPDRVFLKKYLTDEIIFLRPLKVIESLSEEDGPSKAIPKPILDLPEKQASPKAPSEMRVKLKADREKSSTIAEKREERLKAAEALAANPKPAPIEKEEAKTIPPPAEVPASPIVAKEEPEEPPVHIRIPEVSKPAFTPADAEKVKQELSKPNDLDELIEELQHDIEDLRRSKARFNELEKKLEEEDAVEKAVAKATKPSKKKTTPPAPGEPEKKKEPEIKVKKPPKVAQIGIIDEFLAKSPSLPVNTAKAQEKTTQDLSVDSGKFNPEIASEYLAEIFIEQGLKDKAIEIYKTLALNFPDKSVYFADLIKKLDS